jgi:hypothetical protein
LTVGSSRQSFYLKIFDSETVMHNVNELQNIINDSAFEVRESSKVRSSVEKRRAIRVRLDEINEQRELRRLIEEEWNY